VKNKKHTVKQTKEMTKTEKTPGSKDPGGTSVEELTTLDELTALTETLKIRPALLIENNFTGVLIEKQLKQIIFYKKIISKGRDQWNDRIKIKNPARFDANVIFKQFIQFVEARGGINAFINKIDTNVEKLDMILTIEYYTGKIIQHQPFEYYRVIFEDGSTVLSNGPTIGNTGIEIKEIKKEVKRPHKEINETYKPYRGKGYPVTVFLDQFFKGQWAEKYFTVPARYNYWNALLLLFTGNPGILRKTAFRKTREERTPEEQAEVEAFTQKLIGISEAEDPNRPAIKGIDAIKIYNPKVDIQLKKKTDETGEAGDILFAEIINENENPELFNDPEYKREKALRRFYETIGSPEGLRHFMAILEGLDDAGQKGFYVFNMNEHLDRLGYQKHHKGSHKIKNKEKAIDVIRTLSNTVLEVEDPENENFNVSFTLLKTSIRHDKITRKVKDLIISMDPWYIHSFQKTKNKDPQFMRLLRELPKENHRDHPYTLLLTPRLANLWRIEKQAKKTIKLSSIMAVLNIRNTKTFKENIRILESELNYMKSRKHLGDWHHDGNHEKMAESSDPENIKITFVAPDWAIKEINAMNENHENHLTLTSEEVLKPMTKTEFMKIYDYLLKHYSQREMARHMGISRTNLSNYKSGKRDITNEMAQKIRAFYFQELERNPSDGG